MVYSKYHIQSSRVLIDLCGVKAVLTKSNVNFKSELVGVSLANSENGTKLDSWCRNSKFTTTSVLSSGDASINMSFSEGVGEINDATVFDGISPVTGGKLGDWTC